MISEIANIKVKDKKVEITTLKQNVKTMLEEPHVRTVEPLNLPNLAKERQKIRQYIRKDDLATKKKGGVIDWGYLLNAADGF